MREILFKAKRIDNGEWVEGAFLPKTHEIIVNVLDSDIDTPDSYIYEYYKVDIETICQFTGLTDKNNNKIWENDIVEVVVCDETGDIHLLKGAVPKMTEYITLTQLAVANEIEIIGNIFDNAELLEVR